MPRERRAWGLLTKKERGLILALLWRFPADSNCCRRFCRPLPSHSVREPFLFCDAKVRLFFQTAKLFARFFRSFCAVPPFFFLGGAFHPSQFAVRRAVRAGRRLFRMADYPEEAPGCPDESRRDDEICRVFVPHVFSFWDLQGKNSIKNGTLVAMKAKNICFFLRGYNLFYNFPAVFSLVLDGLKNSFWIYGAINLVPLLEEIGDAGSGIPDAISFLPLPEGGGRGGRGSCPPAFGTLASGR